MSLKIAAILMMTALVAHSTAYVTKPRKNDCPHIPGFTYTSKKTADHDELSLTAPEGDVYLYRYGISVNSNPWKFTSENGVNKITDIRIFPSLSVYYNNTKSLVRDVPTTGLIIPYTGNSTYAVTLAASSGTNCVLSATVDAVKMEAPYLWLKGLGVNAEAFKAPVVYKELQEVVGKALVSLPKILTEIFNKVLPEQIEDVAAFCKKLQAASAENFPVPQF